MATTNLSVAATYNNMGIVYKAQGRHEEALVQYQKALEVFLVVYGQEHRAWPRPIVTLVLCTERRATSKTPFFSTKGRSRSKRACSAPSTGTWREAT